MFNVGKKLLRTNLVGKFMSHNRSHHLFLQEGRVFPHQQAGLSEGDETPVLHRSCQEVWDGDQI